MRILINPFKPWAGMSHTPPLRRSTSSPINPKPGTSSLGHVRGSSASACAMLCDHLGPTPAMHTMPAQLRPHAPVKPRESALIPIERPASPRPGLPTPGSSLGPQEYPHRPTHVFPAQHFVLTHAHPGRTSRSVTHRSKPSTLNFGVFFVMGFRKRSCNLLV
jgi:hypothetical protein